MIDQNDPEIQGTSDFVAAILRESSEKPITNLYEGEGLILRDARFFLVQSRITPIGGKTLTTLFPVPSDADMDDLMSHIARYDDVDETECLVVDDSQLVELIAIGAFHCTRSIEYITKNGPNTGLFGTDEYNLWFETETD